MNKIKLMAQKFLDFDDDRPRKSKSRNQPVGFYKIIAVTFLALTIVLLGVIVFMSSKRASIVITTRSEPVEASFSVKIGESAGGSVHVSGVVTTVVLDLEKKFSPDGSKEEPGLATGMVTITNETGSDQQLVATTRLLTPDEILFRMKDKAMVPAGGSVEVEVYADVEGSSGNIGPSKFIIPGLSSSLQKVIYAESVEPMAGGVRSVGVVNQKDFDDAKKILLEEAREQAEGMALQDYPEFRGLFRVIQDSFETEQEFGEEASEFTIAGKATILIVMYAPQEMVDYAGQMVGKQVVGGSEELKAVENEPVVKLDTYNLENKTAVLTTTQVGRVNLDSNSKELQKIMFFGKTEDEIRRYVMSLDHVQGVDMEFRPFWNRSVPHVADHVTIVVREVQ